MVNTKDYLKEFINTGAINKNVRKIIGDSWIRCKNFNVDYNGGIGRKVTSDVLSKKIEQNQQLLFVTKPIMEKMYKTVAGSGFSIILTDNEGCLLEVIGDKNIMEKASELNFIKGALWTEKEVGTNAIGTSLYMDEPIQTIASEHYCKKHHTWSCSAATIHDENNNIIGCLDMSGNYEGAHIHTLGMVLTGAFSIEKQLAFSISNNLINATFQSISDGMVILDDRLKIIKVNDMACSILEYSINEIINLNINKILRDIDFINNLEYNEKPYYNLYCDFYKKKNKRIKCSMNAVPILNNNKNMGTVITFKTIKNINKFVNKVIGFNASYSFNDIITKDKKMMEIIDYSKKVALSNCSVLIEGNSGTGKELFAHAIHNYSNNKNGPFVAVNCASIPRELMESELYGYEKGAFTGAANEGHAGKFELADEGTIFLDEIGELPLDMQSKLLRVLDNKTVTRVGGNYERKLNVRIIAATNRDLEKEILNKNFREDLFYRINVMNIKIISLNKRKVDIELLAHHFVNRLNIHNGKKKVICSKFMKSLTEYSWPGNVRELENIVERAYYLSEGDLITAQGLTDSTLSYQNKYQIDDTLIDMNIVERENIIRALDKTKNNIVNAAKLLGISRATMYRKIKKYNLLK
ncbi:MAG: modulated sigma54 specific transcriptional regulator, Fis family [Clostridiaceae bacterium]|nr:modulated sigma54 specific transcriptional regulator, Fis family [Clostridiaceae bacterium]